MEVPEFCLQLLDYPYLKNAGYFFAYYLFLPTVLVFGLAGNIVCLRVLVKKFLKEHGFQYQVVIIFDLLGNVTTALIVVLVHWGEQTLLVPRECTKYTAFWYQHSYFLVCLSTVGTALNPVFVGMAPYLLFGSALDRCFGLLKPVYYKFRMPKRTVLAVIASIGLVLNILPAIRLLGGTQIYETRLNGSSEVVYKVKRNQMKGPVSDFLAWMTSFRGFFGVGLLVVASVALSAVYRKKDPNREENQAAAGVVATGKKDNAPVTHVLLSRLLLAQCLLVFVGTIPGMILSSLVALGYPFVIGDPSSLMNNLVLLKTVGGGIQISLNVVAYSSVSPRFRREVLAMFKRSGNAVQKIDAA